MIAEPRGHKRTCWAPLLEYIKIITTPKANSGDLDFECAGSLGFTAWDHTVLRTPTASPDLDTKDNSSGLSTTQEISARLLLEASAGSPGSTAWDHTVLRTPTASPDLDTKDNSSGLSTTQEISSRLSLQAKTRELWDEYEESARRKSIDRRYPEHTSEEDNTFSANESARDSHPFPRSKELKASPNVTTSCGLGRTKCDKVICLHDSNTEANEYR
jgi:hypothetical protein